MENEETRELKTAERVDLEICLARYMVEYFEEKLESHEDDYDRFLAIQGLYIWRALQRALPA